MKIPFLLLLAAVLASPSGACEMKRRRADFAWEDLSPLQQDRFSAFRDAQKRADWKDLPAEIRAVYFTVTRAMEKAPGNLLAKTVRVTDIRGSQWTYTDSWPSGEPGLDCVAEPKDELRGHKFEVDVVWERGAYASLGLGAEGSPYVARHDSFLHPDEEGAGLRSFPDSDGPHLLFMKTPPLGGEGVPGHVHIDYRGISKYVGVRLLAAELVRKKASALFGADLTGRESAPPPPMLDLRDPSRTSSDPAMWLNKRSLTESKKAEKGRGDGGDTEGHLRESGADPLAVGPQTEISPTGERGGPIDNLKRFTAMVDDAATDAAVARALERGRKP